MNRGIYFRQAIVNFQKLNTQSIATSSKTKNRLVSNSGVTATSLNNTSVWQNAVAQIRGKTTGNNTVNMMPTSTRPNMTATSPFRSGRNKKHDAELDFDLKLQQLVTKKEAELFVRNL